MKQTKQYKTSILYFYQAFTCTKIEYKNILFHLFKDSFNYYDVVSMHANVFYNFFLTIRFEI